MDDNLHLLESKVLEAVGLIKELRAENGRSTARCDELAAQVADLEDSRARLSEGAGGGGGATAGDVEGYEEKRKEVEDRVGGLLQELPALG